MADFIEEIHKDDTKYFFAFRASLRTGDAKFFVTTLTEDNQTVKFDMNHNGSRWYIVTPAPDWVLGLERHLSEAIIKNLESRHPEKSDL